MSKLIAILAVAGASFFSGANCANAQNVAVAQNIVAQQNVVELGKRIFTHKWIPGDKNSPQGDGLGPLFNGDSCVQCHHQGGIGGGGDLRENVDLLTVSASTRLEKKRLVSAHPGFKGIKEGEIKNTIVLHRFGLDQAYAQARAQMLPFDNALAVTKIDVDRIQRAMKVQPIQKVSFNSKLGGFRSQRNPTALFGAGLIDQISNDFLAGEIIYTKFPGVSGRVAVHGFEPTTFGRFGWRAQTSTLRQFILEASAAELGLETREQHQIADPRNPKYRAPGFDLGDQEVDALVSFVANLQRPEQILPTDPDLLLRVKTGQQRFADVGCADCHVQDRAGIREIYSDLLLHDMGPELEDPIAAVTPKTLRFSRGPIEVAGVRLRGRIIESTRSNSIVSTTGNHRIPLVIDISEVKAARQAASELKDAQMDSASTYYGLTRLGANRIGNPNASDFNLTQEWRTPPLWGVEASAPYMHDGRAETLAEAILIHGGESEESVMAFLNLPTQEQLMLIEFLKTLKAPK